MAGLKGWQWLFILEAIPAIVLGVAAYFILKDRPHDAPWLTADEARALTDTIAREDAARAQEKRYSLKDALIEPRVYALSLVYFGIVAGLYSLTFWTPQIVKSFGLSNTETGFIASLPFLAGAMIMIVWGRHSDQTGERIWHVALPSFVGAAGLVAGGMVAEPVYALLALTIAALGVFAALPTFWTLPTAMLSGTAAAAGIALINSIGNIGGFAGPYVVGWLKGAGFTAGGAVAAIAISMTISGLLVLSLQRPKDMPEA